MDDSIISKKSVVWTIPNFAEVRQSSKSTNEQQINFEMATGKTVKTKTTLQWSCFLNVELCHCQKCHEKEGCNDEWCKKGYHRKSCRREEKNCNIRFNATVQNVPSKLYTADATVEFFIRNYFSGRYERELTDFEEIDEYGEFGERTFLEAWSQDTTFLSADGALEIEIYVTVYRPKREGDRMRLARKHEKNFRKASVTRFCSQLSHLPNSQSLASQSLTKIVSQEGVTFSVDREVLAARSPIFQIMFHSGMQEELKGVVEIKDIDYKSLEALLYFIERGMLPYNWFEEQVFEGLVYGAHKYMVEDLLEFLGKMMGLVCNKENYPKLMLLAKTLGMEVGQRSLIHFFENEVAERVYIRVKEQADMFFEDPENWRENLLKEVEKMLKNGEAEGTQVERINRAGTSFAKLSKWFRNLFPRKLWRRRN